MSLNPQFPQFISVDPHETIRIIKQHQAFETQLLQQLSGSYLVSCFSSWKKLILEKLNYTTWLVFSKKSETSEFPNSDDTGHQTKPFLSDDSDDIPVFVEDWQASYP